MEPASLMLGILPVLGGSLKIYKLTLSTLKVLRHYSREVERIQKHFHCQQQIFLNEVQLILRSIGQDEDLTRIMMEDGNHPKWYSGELEEEMKQYLGKNYSIVNGIAEDIRTVINDIQNGLDCFNCIAQRGEERETLKDTVRRLRDSIKVTFDKSKFEKWIKDLRDSNYDLSRVREQTHQLNKKALQSSADQRPSRKRPSQQPNQFGATRKASRALHWALRSVWLGQEEEFRHTVKLFLDTKPSTEIQLDLIISCLRKGLTARTFCLSNPITVPVHVQSQILDCTTPGYCMMSPESNQAESRKHKVPRLAVGDGSNADKNESQLKLPSQGGSACLPTSLDLSTSSHLCSELEPPSIQCKGKGVSTTCLGYLDTSSEDKFRLSFFACCGDYCRPSLCPSLAMDQSELTRMDEFVALPRAEDLSILHQLQLALRVATAVFKFNATPWLGDVWDLRNLAFFRRETDLPSSLQTLHLSIEPAANSSMMEVDTDAAVSDEVEEARLRHGIQNTTLYCLGVALLSIGWWNPVDPGDVVQVRRMAGRLCPLGPRYQKVTQRVLECDFGYGKDFREPKLEDAVHDGVLLELEFMIASLDLNRHSS